MICINCHNKKTSIVNSRSIKNGLVTWRRHSCPSCGYTFTTHESIPLEGHILVSQNEKTAPFKRGRLFRAIINSLTAVGEEPDDGYWLLENIEQKLVKQIVSKTPTSDKPTVNSQEIASITYDSLYAYNTSAGIAYGAAHNLISTGSQKKRRGRPVGS